MKRDALNKMVDGHREQWDDKQPNSRIWERISFAFFGSKQSTPWNSVALWRAAAILLFGFSAYLLYSQQTGQPKPQLAQQEFMDVESFYASQISEKVKWISNEGRFVDDSFTQDLQKLEAMYTVLSDELKKQPSEKVKDALVLNMLVRIDLLNQQIQKLEESKPSIKPGSAI